MLSTPPPLPYLSYSFPSLQLPHPFKVATASSSSSSTIRNSSILQAKTMSSRRSRASGFTEDEINNLISKLQALLPHSGSRNGRASKVLEETCNYITRLNRDADDLSERLSQLLASSDINAVDIDTIRRLLRQ